MIDDTCLTIYLAFAGSVDTNKSIPRIVETPAVTSPGTTDTHTVTFFCVVFALLLSPICFGWVLGRCILFSFSFSWVFAAPAAFFWGGGSGTGAMHRRVVVVDEAHRMRNKNSALLGCLQQVRGFPFRTNDPLTTIFGVWARDLS